MNQHRYTSDPQPASEFAPGTTLRDKGFLSLDQALHIPPPRELFRGFLTEGDTLLYATQEGGKSLNAVGLNACITSGAPFHKFELAVEPGLIVYVVPERYRSVAPRVRAWELHNGIEVPRNRFVLYTKAVELQTDKSVSEYIKNCKRIQDAVGKPIIAHTFDTLTWMLAGEEQNSETPVHRAHENIVRIREETGALSTLTIDHAGKDESRGARGSSAKRDWDVILALKKKHDKVHVEATKWNDFDEFTPFDLKIETAELPSDEFPGMSTRERTVPVLSSGGASKLKLDKKHKQILDLLKRGPRQWTDLRTASGIAETTFRRKLDELRHDGRVAVDSDGYYYRQNAHGGNARAASTTAGQKAGAENVETRL